MTAITITVPSRARAARCSPTPSEPAALAALVDHARESRDWVRLALLQARRFAIATVGASARRSRSSSPASKHASCTTRPRRASWICRGIEAAPDAAELYARLAALARERRRRRRCSSRSSA